MWQIRFVWIAITIWLSDCKQLSPVILVPGVGGSRIEAKLNKTSPGPYVFCDLETKDYYTLWVNVPSVVTPSTTRCLIENFRLVYDNKTHTTSSPEGVHIRIPKFGDTDAVEFLNEDHWKKLGYYDEIVNNMVKWGYVRNKTVRGAPYDFRRSPNELKEFYFNLTTLVEETYAMNNNTKVIIMGHSMGNLVILYYLNHQPQPWKDKYIQSFITLAAPWGGSLKALKMLVSGDNVDVALIRAIEARLMQRSMTSSAFLLPTNEFWNKTEVLIQTPFRNYTIDDYQQLFYDLNFTDGYSMTLDTEHLVNPLRPPNVQVYCLYGNGLKTAGRYLYTKDQWPDKQPKPIYDDGDRTVNIRSLEGCLPWRRLQRQPVSSKAFRGIDHTDILKHGVVINYLHDILLNN